MTNQSQSQHPSSWVLILVALIGATGVVLAAVLQPRPSDPVPTPIPIATSVLLTAPPTNTPSPAITDTLLPVVTNTPLPIPTDTHELPTPALTNTNALVLSTPANDCDQRKEVREVADSNETRIYTRCPVGEIQYSLQTDDFLESVVLQCPRKDDQIIEFKLNEERSKDQLLPTYDTAKFSSYPNCRVSITINNAGGLIGYTIWREIVGSLP